MMINNVRLFIEDEMRKEKKHPLYYVFVITLSIIFAIVASIDRIG